MLLGSLRKKKKVCAYGFTIDQPFFFPATLKDIGFSQSDKKYLVWRVSRQNEFLITDFIILTSGSNTIKISQVLFISLQASQSSQSQYLSGLLEKKGLVDSDSDSEAVFRHGFYGNS